MIRDLINFFSFILINERKRVIYILIETGKLKLWHQFSLWDQFSILSASVFYRCQKKTNKRWFKKFRYNKKFRYFRRDKITFMRNKNTVHSILFILIITVGKRVQIGWFVSLKPLISDEGELFGDSLIKQSMFYIVVSTRLDSCLIITLQKSKIEQFNKRFFH